MAPSLIQPHSYRPPKDLPFIDDLTLAEARVHEFCGPSRRSLAIMLGARTLGHIYWIHSAWETDRLYAPGILRYVNPGRITYIRPKRLEDILWCMEETLRAGCIGLTVAETPTPPHLTPIRRLNLAAQEGARKNKTPLLGVILTPSDGGAQGVETRWHFAPKHQSKYKQWKLQRCRARHAAPAAWTVLENNNTPYLAPRID